MIYVGANDGMLHGIDAKTMETKFSYLPSKKLLTSNDGLYHNLMADQPALKDAGIRRVTRIGDGLAPGTIAAAVYLHIAAFGGAVVSGFWSVVNERFDPYAAKKAIGKIAGGATFGGVLGGVLTWLLADLSIELLLGAEPG